MYAKAGVLEYWVLDVVKREFWVHRGPYAGGWRERFLVTKPHISPLCAPDAVIDVSALIGPR